MRALHESKSFVWTLLILFILVWLYMLGVRTLVPTDEGRYAEMAREMVATQDWITTRLNGIKYFEKPPLQTWMNAITFELFGLGEWQARLWTGLCGLFGIGLVAYTGRRIYNGRVAFYAALVLGSSFYWAGMGHINSLDMGLSGMMTLALCSLLLAQRYEANAKQQRNWMLLCWAGMALAVLSKGLIGIVLPGAVLVLYTLVARDWGIWKRLHLIKGLIVFFAITTPWFVLVSQRNPEFLEFFFIHEHFQRFTTKIHSRVGPWYYFIPLLLLGILPWLGVFFQSMFNSIRRQPSETHMISGESHGRFKPSLLLLECVYFCILQHFKL
jgi:4-amino-4-deoxy-L-arabinose transferase-like glycosyltransferase